MRLLAISAIFVFLLVPSLSEARTKSTFRVSLGGAVVAGAAALVWSVTVERGAWNEENKKYAVKQDAGQSDEIRQEEAVDSGAIANLPVLRIRF